MKYIPLIACALTLASSHALAQDADDAPAIVMKADRVLIYPQRMDLQGDESLLDVIMMYPDLMQSGWASLVSSYNVRIDNAPVNMDNRIFLSQLKAKLVSKVQICDNTAVAKGTVGMNRVMDINMLRNDESLHGHVQGEIGTDNMATASTELRLGTEKTDVYATASYSYADQDDVIGQEERVFAHMTNWFTPHDRLLSYFCQQYFDTKDYTSGSKIGTDQQRYLIRERYFHNFNDVGTELLIVAGYQRTNTPRVVTSDDEVAVNTTSQDALLGIVELNTPLGSNLSMMLGWEGDFNLNKYCMADGSQKYNQMNNDAYLQLNLTAGPMLITLGDRPMFYHYSVGDKGYNDARNNFQASVIGKISNRQQAQIAFHRKFSNPSFAFYGKVTDDEWQAKQETLTASYINEVKASYTYTRKSFSLTVATYLLGKENANDEWKLQAAASFTRGIFAITGGANYHDVEGADNNYATFHLEPRLAFAHGWQLSARGVIGTSNATLAHDEDSYLELQLAKQIGEHVCISADWHDISDSDHSAAMAKLQFKF